MTNNAAPLKELADRYRANARALSQERKNLVQLALGLVNEEIVPEIRQHLPPHYDFDSSKTEILNFDSGDEEVPISLSIGLRVTYKGQDIGIGNRAEGDLGMIQQSLEPILEPLARKYGIDHIFPMAEPVMIG